MIVVTNAINTYIIELNGIANFTIIKIVQASHNQADARYDQSRRIQWSCMSLISISCTLFKLSYFKDLIDLDSILQKGYELFKPINEFKSLGVEDLPYEFFMENCLIDVDFLENRTGEVTAGEYLVSVGEIISSCQQVWSGTLPIVNNYF